MTQQEYENKIKDLEKQIEELKAVKIEKPQSKRWKPNELGNAYWTVNNMGEVEEFDWYNSNFDKWHYLTGNCFKTEEEAEEYKKQIEYTALYKNYIEEHSEPLDWCNESQRKYFAGYNISSKKIFTDYNCGFQYLDIYASSEQIILDAINEIGEDNFKKYVLGVK